MTDKTPLAEAGSDDRAREFYEHISERLSFNGRPLTILGSDSVLPGQEESAKLGKNLKRIRTAKGISQGEIGRILGVDRGS